MGIIVECNEQELWSPSLGVGNFFFAQIKALELLVQESSGISAIDGDLFNIDADLFQNFIKVVIKKLEETNNTPLLALSSGCLEICIALNAKITGKWPTVSPQLESLLTRSQKVMLPISFYILSVQEEVQMPHILS